MKTARILGGASFVVAATLLPMQLAGAAGGRGAAMSVAEQKAFVERYCEECHNPSDIRGSLMLSDLDLERPETSLDLAEKVIRKVGVKMMPPPGQKRADDATTRRFIAGLEGSVDRYAAAHPDLGNPPLHRMNRAEYANSVRELLDVNIDATKLLPGDVFSHGFDNMADVLGLSPSLMEAYVRAAGKVSRQALGEPDAAPLMATYQVPRVVAQMKHVEGTPFGTRGGTVVTHDFPADGDYTFRVTFYHSIEGPLFGATQGKTQQIEISINGERVGLFPIDPGVTKYDELMTPPIHVKAGPQKIAAAFLVNADGPVEDAVMPVGFSLIDLNQATLAGLTTLPHLHELIVGGPLKVSGVSETPSRRKVFTCTPRSDAERAPCARSIVTRLAAQAWRRPLSQDEVGKLMTLYGLGEADEGFEGGVGVSLQAILASPNFVYRFERQPEVIKAGVESHRISDLELASRLSYFLWSSAPDAALLELAAGNRLHRESVLKGQVARMLRDPRSIALSDNFASQWLHLQNLKGLRPDGYLYPMYDQSVGDAMREETVLFFDSVVRENRSVLTLLDGRYTFVNEKLAALYGIPNVSGNRFRRVELTDEDRFGLLGKASLLALTSASNRTSPVMRGKYVMEIFLGTPPPPPPPDVPGLKEEGESNARTVRARLEEHRTNPNCAGCHKYFDPMGFALETFDPIGAKRGFDAFAPIDAKGELFDGTPVEGPASLRRALVAHSSDFIGSFSEALFAYGMGRVLRPQDMTVVREIQRQARRDGNTFSSFVLAIVESEPFQRRVALPAEPAKQLTTRAN
ncbi:MAG: DUF1592 domain-containing protein [Steroidobacteraceae bacterium]